MKNEIQAIPQDARAVKPMSVLNELASRYSIEPSKLMSTLKETVAKNCTDSQLAAFCIVCNEYKLNPFLKEIYAFPGKNGEVVPVVGIDGWTNLINSHPQFDGLETDFSPDGSACTCTMHRKDRAHPVVITEYLAECHRNTEPWNKAPRRMLRHKAIIQAARVAFGFSGIFDEKEEAGISDTRDVTPARPALSVEVAPAPEPEPDPAPAPSHADMFSDDLYLPPYQK